MSIEHATLNKQEFQRLWVDDLQKEIGNWAAETFLAATSLSTYEKLKEEVRELERAIATPCVGHEIADCMIALLVLAEKQGVSAAEEIRKKFEINKARKWGPPNAAGVYSHVREATP